jgi:hypothetical protein
MQNQETRDSHRNYIWLLIREWTGAIAVGRNSDAELALLQAAAEEFPDIMDEAIACGCKMHQNARQTTKLPDTDQRNPVWPLTLLEALRDDFLHLSK